MEKRILLIEDDPDIAGLVRLHLRDLNFEVELATDGLKGLELALSGNFDLVILDLMLPKLDGHQVCKKIRQRDTRLPILMLTLKSELVDKVLGLELGADDYMTKPFSIQELQARVKALLRRAEVVNESDQTVLVPPPIKVGELLIDRDKRRVTLRGVEVELTPKQLDLLVLLASNPGRPYSRQELLDRVWGYQSSGYEHTIDTHVNRLRSKLEPNPSNPTLIITVWGVGYKFAEEAELKKG